MNNWKSIAAFFAMGAMMFGASGAAAAADPPPRFGGEIEGVPVWQSVNDVQTVHQNIIRTLDESDAALSAQARLNRELQQSLMRIRMVPFQSVAERLYRVVRQAAKELDKRAVLDIRGAQV